MLKFTVEKTLDAPLAAVWALLENFGNLDWYPGPSRIEVIGSGVGMTRRLHMDGGISIEEVLETMDAAQHRFSYRIPNIPMPVTDYRGSVRLEGVDGGGRTKVFWSGELTPVGIAEADAKALMEGVYADMMVKLEAAAQRAAA